MKAGEETMKEIEKSEREELGVSEEKWRWKRKANEVNEKVKYMKKK